MAAPVLQSGEVRAAVSASSSWSVNKPASVAAGDLLLVIIGHGTSVTWNTPAGWTAIRTQTGVTPQMASFYRVADGSEGASFTFTTVSGNTTGNIICHRITGAHPTSPVDGSSGSQVAGGGGNPITLASITTAGADRLLFLQLDAVSSGSTITFTTPTGMSAGYVYNGAGANNHQVSAFKESIASAGSTGTRSSNVSNTAVARSGLMFAIAPGGHTVVVGQATETDTSQPVAKVKTRAAAQSTETDASQALAKLKTRALVQAVEADTAQAVAKVKTRAAAQATETDVAQAITPAKSAALGEPVEVEAATPITPAKAGALGQAIETDESNGAGAAKAAQLGQAEEIDTARPVFAPGIVKPALETDAAQPLTPAKVGLLVLVAEVEAAMPIIAFRAPRGDGYTDAVVGILTVAPTTGIFTSPANRN